MRSPVGDRPLPQSPAACLEALCVCLNRVLSWGVWQRLHSAHAYFQQANIIDVFQSPASQDWLAEKEKHNEMYKQAGEITAKSFGILIFTAAIQSFLILVWRRFECTLEAFSILEMEFSQFLDLTITTAEKCGRNFTLVPITIFSKIHSTKIR